jgi:hypothetical protein
MDQGHEESDDRLGALDVYMVPNPLPCMFQVSTSFVDVGTVEETASALVLAFYSMSVACLSFLWNPAIYILPHAQDGHLLLAPARPGTVVGQ